MAKPSIYRIQIKERRELVLNHVWQLWYLSSRGLSPHVGSLGLSNLVNTCANSLLLF